MMRPRTDSGPSYRQGASTVVTTDAFPSDPLNKILPVVGQLAPRYMERHRMSHGRYLSGFGEEAPLRGHGDEAQRARQVVQSADAGSPDLAMNIDREPDWRDPLMASLEIDEDSVGSGIFDPAGQNTVHTEMGVFADHPAVPGYIARNPPFYFNPEVEDVTADANVLEVPGGGLFYVERGGKNVSPVTSPWGSQSPYAYQPCVSQHHPRQPDSWKPRNGGQRAPFPMENPPPHLRTPGSNMPTAPYNPPPPDMQRGTPSALGPMPRGTAHDDPRYDVPRSGPGSSSRNPPPGGPSLVGPGAIRGRGGRPHHRPKNDPANLRGYAGFGAFGEPVSSWNPMDTTDVPFQQEQSRVPFQHAESPVGYLTINEPVDMTAPIHGGMGHYGYFGEDPAPTPTPAPAADTGAGLGTYFAWGIGLGVAAAVFVSAMGGKSK